MRVWRSSLVCYWSLWRWTVLLVVALNFTVRSHEWRRYFSRITVHRTHATSHLVLEAVNMVPETPIPEALRALIFFPKALPRPRGWQYSITFICTSSSETWWETYYILVHVNPWEKVGSISYLTARHPLRPDGQHIIFYCTSTPKP